jgi:phage terminase large subunit-like protein
LRGLTFDEESMWRALDFFPEILTVEVDDEAVPFELLDWQAFVIGSLFGWYILDPDSGKYVRRFNSAYIETGKGSGKSPLAAGVGIYCMVADGVSSAEVYAAATIKSQAMILFNDATAMIERSNELKERLTPSGGNPVWQWTHKASRSKFKPLAKEEAVSGPRPNCALIDEFHEHKTDDAVTMLEAGFKSRVNPLLFVITNSGSDPTTPCGQMHDWALEVAKGEYDIALLEAVDRFFSFVTCLDEGDDPLNDETCWPKANPSLGKTIGLSYLRKQVATAKSQPSKQNKVLRLNFCVWTDAADAWVTKDAWEKCEVETDFREKHKGEKAFGGLDLSFTRDLSAKAVVWPSKNAKGELTCDAELTFYKPKRGLQAAIDRDKRPYDAWANVGDLKLTEGLVIKLDPIAQDMGQDADDFDLEAIAYDAYRHRELADNCSDQGIVLPFIEHPQGFRRAPMKDANGEPVIDPKTGKRMENPLWMPNSVQELENMIFEGRLRVKVNRVLRWNVASTVIREDPAGTDNKIFDKRRATGRIDGVVALAQAIGAAKAGLAAPASPSSPWESEDFSLMDA